MGILDIILLLCFIPGIVRGITKGFVQQLISLASIFIGAWLAVKFSSLVSTWLMKYIELDPKIIKVISFAVIVILAVLLLYWIGQLVSKVIKIATLGWLDKLLGIVFAILKVALVLGLLIMLFEGVNGKLGLVKADTLDDSALYCAIRDFGQTVLPFLKKFISGGNAVIEV